MSTKPHHLAFKLDEPCPRCGSTWGRPALDLSDPTVLEIPLFTACARCGKRLSVNETEAVRAAGAAGETR